jgi:S-adenosylmethionine decarboxylase
MSSPTLERVAPSAAANGAVGRELIVEIWEPSGVDLTDKDTIRAILMRAVKSSGSTLIRSYFHRLHPGGITGFLLLKESHISIHTWPEYGYAALDFFTCGQTDSHKGLEEVTRAFKPKTVKVTELIRGARDDS